MTENLASARRVSGTPGSRRAKVVPTKTAEMRKAQELALPGLRQRSR